MNNLEYLDHVLSIVRTAEKLGTKTLDNGTVLIGSVPHLGPEAWLHVLYAGLDAGEIDEVRGLIRRPLPHDFAWFLSHFNGISLFSGALSIDGLRRSYARGRNAIRQPFSLEDTNVLERVPGVPDACVFVGGYKADGSVLYVCPPESRVARCQRDSPTPLQSWPSFMATLSSETSRLSTLYDERGRKVNPSASTAP